MSSLIPDLRHKKILTAKSRLYSKNRVNLMEQENHSDKEDESEFVYAISSGRGRPQVDLRINVITVLAKIETLKLK